MRHLVTLALCVGVSTSAGAGEPPLNSRIRIRTTDDRTLVGILAGSDASALTVQRPGHESHVIAFDEIAGLEVSRRQKSAKAKWALIGAVPWVVVVAATLIEGGPDESGILSPQSALLLAGGVGSGLVIGSRKRTDVWERAPLPSSGSAATGRGFEVGVRLAF